MAITRIFERLYLSGAGDADDLAVSNPLGITAVVNVETQPNRSKRAGIQYVHFHIDESERILPGIFGPLIAALTQLVRTGKVLVHCEIGSSRSPVVAALYLHVVGYKNFDEALAEIKALRPVVSPSKSTVASAKAYLEELI
jgi:protein-tyrosine phosphatase